MAEFARIQSKMREKRCIESQYYERVVNVRKLSFPCPLFYISQKSGVADYSRLAPLYLCFERLIYRQALQRCRTAFLTELPASLLVIGEGDGRFSEAVRKAYPKTKLTLVEPDAAMREEGMKRSPESEKVRWLSEFPKEPHIYDALILNFVADCHEPEELKKLLQRTSPLLSHQKIVIVGDFFPEEVSNAPLRFMARALVKVMYLFFRLSAAVRVQQLPPTQALLKELGWTCSRTHSQWRGFIQAQWWEKKAPATQ